MAFGNTLWSTSSAVLQRFASAGVQPITFGAGLALASQFKLDRLGNQRMHDALNNLQGAPGFEKLLWFGFGVRSFLRVMSDSQLGVQCIALCSCLAEVHGAHVSAWILEELWKAHGFPECYLPSHAQFLALIKACSGVLTRTSFSRATNHMVGNMIGGTGMDAPLVSDVEDIAKAIRGLFQVSNGTVSRITVTGGQECAFVAAFAQWLLNLKIYVEDKNGVVVYGNTFRETAQVVVKYIEISESSLIQISSTTYILRDAESLFVRHPTLDKINLIIRTPWNGCLGRIFGTTFNELLGLPYILGGFLGSVARLYSSLATGGADVANFSRDTYINFVEGSHGHGFVNSVGLIFPELASSSTLLEVMRNEVNSSVEDALRNVEQTVRALARRCACSSCTSPGVESEKYCLLSTAISIRTMVSAISCTARDGQLFPTVSGIQSIYREMRDFVSTGIRQQRDDLPFLSVALGLETENMYSEFAVCYRQFDLMSRAVEIFSGISYHCRNSSDNPKRHGDICTAIVHQGVCYYLDCLRSINSQAETARVVHVLPGHIQKGDRQFDQIFDGSVSNRRLAAVQYKIIEEPDSIPSTEEPRSDDISIEALALEKAIERELVLFYKISVPGEPTFLLRPGRLTHEILKRTGLIICKGNQCNKQLAFPCALIYQGWRTTQLQRDELRSSSSVGFGCCIWPPMSNIARCVAISQNKFASELFLRRKECLSCSTVAVTRDFSERRFESYHIIC